VSELQELVAEAKRLDILRSLRAIDVHCPTCGARLHAFGECPRCGMVGSDEAQLRRLDPTVAKALLERSIARRKAWTPPARAGAKSEER
jgi:tRNA(Ile2) C34 agmatinyltransferase TiaS